MKKITLLRKKLKNLNKLNFQLFHAFC